MTETDRELLELAAKAAGMDTFWDQPPGASNGFMRLVDKQANNWRIWNPLTDDGDALRLAVKLKITPNPDASGTEQSTAYHTASGRCISVTEKHEDNADPYAATRRAIVRAAASIGKERE